MPGGAVPIEEVLKAAGSGALRLPAGVTFSFAEVAKAVAASEAGDAKGQILLRPCPTTFRLELLASTHQLCVDG